MAFNKEGVVDESNTCSTCQGTTGARRSDKIVQRWASLCDDELHDPTDHDEQQQRRSVRLHPQHDGMWRLDGLLDPLTGETLAKAFDAFMPKPWPTDPRTTVMRRHDTLRDIALDVLARTDRPDVGGERPHVTVIVDAKTGDATTDAGYRPPWFVRDELLCDPTITTVWLGRTGQPFAAGTPKSPIPNRTRRAVLARDRCCRFPGCDRPARWTDLHHMTWREDGGSNEPTNLTALCRFHHRFVHRHDLDLRFDGDTLVVVWPNGLTQRSPPHTGYLFA